MLILILLFYIELLNVICTNAEYRTHNLSNIQYRKENIHKQWIIKSSVLETCAVDSPLYLLFSVNQGEGFNLRRDVFLRVANLVHSINSFHHQLWVLVLPPWGDLYHWKTKNKFYPWKYFFDLPSIRKWIPVIELQDYIKANGNYIDKALVLQNYIEGWGEKFEEKYDIMPCIQQNLHYSGSVEGWHMTKWSEEFHIDNFTCISVQGRASTISPILKNEMKNKRSLLLDRAEVLLHDEFGGYDYWAARRSMRFASHLVEEASRFRKTFLNSDDAKDNVLIPPDWTLFIPPRNTSIGGSYLSVHLRRRDFIYARSNEVPSILHAADQLSKLLSKHRLKILFVATDAPKKELNELRSYLKDINVFNYVSSSSFYNKWGDGGGAIVDQIICSHAKFFVGSFESTFSFRIQEEREIMGFSVDSTFNRLCGKNPDCAQPTRWTIVSES